MRQLDEWEIRARDLLKGELAVRRLTYKQLSEKLAAIGIQESEGGLRVKVLRGSFTAAFLLQCFTAIGSDKLRSD
jgi:hypothetical protein